MNILYLCDEYPPGRHGGIGTVVQLLGREMAKKGHNVIVAGFYDWGYGGDDEFDDEGVHVYRFRRGLAGKFFENTDSLIVRAAYKMGTLTGLLERDIKASLKKYHIFLEALIVKYKIDIVEMADYNDYVRFCNHYMPFPSLSVPVIVKLHGTLTYFTKEVGGTAPQAVTDTEHQILEQAKAIASVSKYTAEKTALYFNYKKEIEVLYNGIHLQETGAIAKQDKKVIFTGSLAEKKGIYQLMKAWNIVAEKMPDASLVVYGKGPVEKISRLLSSNAAQTVFFKGHVSRDELFKELSSSSVAVFPSYAECFALGPMEAMTAGTAVIYTQRTSGPELIEDGKNGILINPDDVADMANEILQLLNDADRCSRLAEAGKKRIAEHFDISLIADKHIDYYKKIIAS